MKRLTIIALAALATSSSAFAAKKSIFSIFGDSKKFVEVTCYGLPAQPSPLTLTVPSIGSETYERDFAYSEAGGIQITVSSKKVEQTLTVEISRDEQSSATVATSGLDVRFKNNDTDITCELNDGEQITDL